MTTTDYSISKAQEIALLFGAQTPEQYLYEFVEGILIMANATVPSGFGGQVVGEEIYRLPLKISGRQKGLLREAIDISRARAEMLDEIERLRARVAELEAEVESSRRADAQISQALNEGDGRYRP